MFRSALAAWLFAFVFAVASAGSAGAAPATNKTKPLQPAGGFAWTGWESLGGVLVSGPDCVVAGAERVDCFARGQDGQMLRRWWDGSAWQAWSTARGVANAAFYQSRPACVSWGVDHIDCFVRRHGDGAMFRRTWDGAYVHSWENLGGTLTSDPECVSKAPERLDCFARGQDGAMWQNSFDGNVWGGWVSRGGELIDQAKPACALRAGDEIDCVAVWASDKKLRHFAVNSPDDGWDVVAADPITLPSRENANAGAKCFAAPDDERVECFAPFRNAATGERSLLRASFDGGSWDVSDLKSDFGREAFGADKDLQHYDFDCVVHANERFDCMELTVWQPLAGAPAAGTGAAKFRHYSYVSNGVPAFWNSVALTMPIRAGNVTFLRCVSADGERIDCFTGGNWLGNSTLNQASYVYQERIAFKPMKPVR